MPSKIPHILRSASVQNVSKLLTANVFAQVIGLLVYPVLTRLYAPEDFGLFNLFTSIGGTLVLIATFEWHKAIVLPKEDEQARAAVHLSMVPVIALTVLVGLTIPFARPILGLCKSAELAPYYWLLPVYVLLQSVWNILNYWYIRRKAFGSISGYQVSQSLFSAGYKAGFGWLGYLSGGLIYASVLSPLCGLLLSIGSTAKKHLRYLLHWNAAACREVAGTYRNFPKYSLPHSLINYIAGQLPVLLLTPFFGTRLVGFWGMAVLLSFAPISMITNALYQVLYQKTTMQVNARSHIALFYRQFTIWSIAVIVPFFAGLWFILPWLTQWFLGDEWRVSGEYIRWLLPWLLCMFLCASTGYLFDIFGKQKQGLTFEIIIAIGRLAGLGIGIWRHDFMLAIACYAIVSAVINGIQYIWLMSLVKKYEDSL